ncbi:hypothetical protein VL20_3211 [Microcystis panniformis FACHB-1757]|uniref:Uncharacterized protein n=1 Tax=Microcystis panniformis FACHB-1757 TaxID=1638788 RepID=A0A0K1S254_9CHRO|nr:hypothetical protein VL20_3211 [Microcystis panniformis FACHB-1757]
MQGFARKALKSLPRLHFIFIQQTLSSHAKLITCPIELKPLRGNDRHV